MKITRDELIELAKLNYFELDNEQCDKLMDEIDDIIHQFIEIKNINTSNIKLTNYIANFSDNKLREDIVKQDISPREILKNSNNIIDEYVVVK